MNESPMTEQYNELKIKYPTALLLFRCNDFYEALYDDAVLLANTTGLILTSRQFKDGTKMNLSGFHLHQLQTNLPKLLKAGITVGIIE